LLQQLKNNLVFTYLSKWMIISLLVSVFIGTGSALFLTGLTWATDTRELNTWLIYLLPIAGLIIGYFYHQYGVSVVGGNNLLIDEVKSPKKKIPLKMAPMVVLGTIITHLFGGSAGREGTAVQMGGAISDQFTSKFGLKEKDRKILIALGVSGGFAAVFGTPLAGFIFAFEILLLGKMKYLAILPCLITAFLSDYFCTIWGVGHTHYSIEIVPSLTGNSIFWSILVGIISGLVAMLFSRSTHFFTSIFKLKISYAPLRPFIGGIVLAVAVLLIGTTKYIGLGLPTIVSSFQEKMLPYDFLLKFIFTAFTLGAGFKGGEVTPLFFIGATLGNALIWFVPLPMGLLAGMGFLAVFSGAANAPIACVLMGVELFGIESVAYISIASITAYFSSGMKGIYTSQVIGKWKTKCYQKLGVKI
jgi:H+/Cl- antiporter ClcA